MAYGIVGRAENTRPFQNDLQSHTAEVGPQGGCCLFQESDPGSPRTNCPLPQSGSCTLLLVVLKPYCACPDLHQQNRCARPTSQTPYGIGMLLKWLQRNQVAQQHAGQQKWPLPPANHLNLCWPNLDPCRSLAARES